MSDKRINSGAIHKVASSENNVSGDPSTGSPTYYPEELIHVISERLPSVEETDNLNKQYSLCVEVNISLGESRLVVFLDIEYMGETNNDYAFFVQINHTFFKKIQGIHSSVTHFAAHFHNLLMIYCRKEKIDLSRIDLSDDCSYWDHNYDLLTQPFTQTVKSARVSSSRLSPSNRDEISEIKWETENRLVSVSSIGEFPCELDNKMTVHEGKHFMGQITMYDRNELDFDLHTKDGINVDSICLQFGYDGDHWSDISNKQVVYKLGHILNQYNIRHQMGYPKSFLTALKTSLGEKIYKVVNGQALKPNNAFYIAQVQMTYDGGWSISSIIVKPITKFSKYINYSGEGFTMTGMLHRGSFKSFNMDDLYKLYRTRNAPQWRAFKAGNYFAILVIIETLACEIKNAMTSKEAWYKLNIGRLSLSYFFGDYELAVHKSKFIKGVLANQKPEELIRDFEKEILS